MSEYQSKSAAGSGIEAAMPGAPIYPPSPDSEVAFVGSGIHVEIEPKATPDSGHRREVKQNTDPRTPEGAAWLTEQYEEIYNKVKDPASKPPRDVLDRIISGDLKPEDDRTGLEVYWEHILLRYCGDCTSTGGENYLELDIVRNYSTRLNFAHTGDLCFSAKGLDAIKVSAAWLNYWLATTEYDVYDTLIRDMGDGVTQAYENWAYRDPTINHNQVKDGFDWFEITGGKIVAKMIRYTVEPCYEGA